MSTPSRMSSLFSPPAAQGPPVGWTPQAAFSAQAAVTPTEKAAQVVAWLDGTGLCRRGTEQRRTLQPWLDAASDTGTCTRRSRALQTCCTFLTPTQADSICRFFIDRAHAERADPTAVQTSLSRALEHLLKLMHEGRPAYSIRTPAGAPHLLQLRAPHYDGCFFDPSQTVVQGGQGAFYVGVSPRGHALAVKCVRAPAETSGAAVSRTSWSLAREARTTRRARQLDLLQFIATPQMHCMVMPLCSCDLSERGAVFFSLHHPPRAGAEQTGLFGARHVVRSLLSGLSALLDAGVVHEDIKARNIGLKRDTRQFKIIDYGVAAVMELDASAKMLGYTPRYAAPEQLGRHPRIDHKVDVYSLALTAFDMLLSCEPLASYRNERFAPQRSDPFPPARQLRALNTQQRGELFAAIDGSAWGTPRIAPQAMPLGGAFESVHASIDAFDQPLGALLRRMLHHDPAQRCTAPEAAMFMDKHMRISAQDEAHIVEAWRAHIPRFSPQVRQQLLAVDHTVQTKLVQPGPSQRVS
jgi:serine/threonine protein kinase